MGCFDVYCSFCAGPLEDARSCWLSFIATDADGIPQPCDEIPWPPADGKWLNPPGYPVPAASIKEIVCISTEDGKYWDAWSCVAPMWDKNGWVSPDCVQNGYGAAIASDGSTAWRDAERYLHIHRGCLSFLCRRLSITPQILWESLYKDGSDYRKYGEAGNGLLYHLDYYGMKERCGQTFQYAVERFTESEDAEGKSTVDRWFDPESMMETAWLLTRPSCLPMPAESPAPKEPPTIDAACMSVLGVFELMDLILLATINDEDLSIGLRTLFALGQVNRFLHDALTRSHQAVWLRLAALHGWMLPCTPADWREWGVTELDPRLDWYSFVLANLKMQPVSDSLKNRRRMERMCEQFAKGKKQLASDGSVKWKWQVGRLCMPSRLTPPVAWAWET
ncbi:hypothetical protein FB45DRAFT_798406 [Roridomyces roridus]|uniref:Uncharacterized protein n=1 Tax=Roridomyces roridus TaxID=1738132 RepID=A0AAD7BIT8_9AGAR|nr:hypothetical protein FB45DRAFT_798406 [Roridomyces roridus]